VSEKISPCLNGYATYRLLDYRRHGNTSSSITAEKRKEQKRREEKVVKINEQKEKRRDEMGRGEYL
jgi:predicted GIY-YIG superfamily endonuclease